MRRLILFFLISNLTFALESPVYETVVVEKSAPEVLGEDQYLPSLESPISRGFGKGSIARDLEVSLGMPTRNTGSKPGALTSFSGIGRSSEEVGFNALGVPLNPPQGGGFDLSSFPQYLWSRQRYQLGGVSGAYDPRASAATIALTPWSQDAMNMDAPGVEIYTNNSSANLVQTALGAHAQRENFKSAFLIGNSTGSVEGPSGGFSLGVGSFKAHFIGTDQSTKVLGSKTNPTPNAQQRTIRGIPVFEYGTSLNKDWRLQSTAFYDIGFIRLEDAENTYNHTRDHFNQLGTIIVAENAETKVGGGFRKVEYSGLTFTAPSQSIYHLTGSRKYHTDDFSIEPFVKVVGDQSVGVLPEGGVSFRENFKNTPWALFSRVTYSNQLPSLSNRYYKTDSSFYQFLPNENLKPEKMISPVIGAEVRADQVKATLEGVAQFRRDTQIVESKQDGSKTIDHPVNAGLGRMYSAVEHVWFDLNKDFSLSESLTYSVSRLSKTGQPFPYQRRWSGSFMGRYRFIDLSFRGADDAFVSDSIRVPAYGLFDLGVHGSWFSGSIEAHLQVENLFNREIEEVFNYQNSGRIVALSIVGRF